jgi:HAMP domain-containing protein
MSVTTRVLVLLAALAGLAFYFGPHRNLEQDEDRLANIAAVIAGHDVEIACPGTLATLTEVSATDGSVVFSPDGRPAKEAKLSSKTCKTLRGFLHGRVSGLGCLSRHGACSTKVREAAIAVNVLSHEAWHLAGVRDEAVAQCYALQSNADTAMRLGATQDDANAIAGFILREVQPALPADYRSRDCFDDGPLDLHRDRPVWP